MLPSGTSMNHRVEAEQSEDIRGKTLFYFRKIWLSFTKIAVLCDVETCIVKCHFLKLRVMVKLRTVALKSSSRSNQTGLMLLMT